MRKWLKELRTKSGMSQLQVARNMKISQNYYSYIEIGERQKDLSLSTINKIAKLFGVSVEYIIDQENKKEAS